MSYLQQYTKIIKMSTLEIYFSKILSKLKHTRSQMMPDLYVFKLEVFIWCHVVNVPKSSTTFRGILICAIFKPGICKNTFLCSVLHWRIISIKRFFSGVHACVNGAWKEAFNTIIYWPIRHVIHNIHNTIINRYLQCNATLIILKHNIWVLQL